MRATPTTPPKVSQKRYLGTINRLSKKSLPTVLIEKFLNQYGYEKGIVAATALVTDIIETVDNYYLKANTLQPGQLIWLAADKDEKAGKGKTLNNTKQRVVKLTLVSPNDFELLANGQSNFRDIQNRRVIRLIKEAYQQKAALTTEDLMIILSLNASYISDWINVYQDKSGKILPTRGNVADIGPAITHKKKIVELHRQGNLPPAIARQTNHSLEAVDRYIADFERIKTLKERKFTAGEICFLTNKGLSLVKEYLKLLP